MKEKNTDLDLQSFICFHLADSNFGINIDDVLEVNKMLDITRVPKAPKFIEGLINLRGEVVPVVDLKRRLGLEKADYASLARIIVINVEDSKLGIIVDRMAKSIVLSNDAVEPPSPVLTGVEFLKGVGKTDSGLLLLLDAGRIITKEEKDALVRFREEKNRKTVEEKKEPEKNIEEIEFVTFLMGNEWYGIKTVHVQEVLRKPAITNVPHAPDFVVGVINMRGKIIPAVDLKRLWHSPSTLEKTAMKVVVISVGGIIVGVLADSVSKNVFIAINIIDETLSTIQDERKEYINGEAKLDDGRLLIVLAIEKIMVSARMRFL